MTDTKFPWDEIADNYGEEYIMPWFKRCIEDNPIDEQNDGHYVVPIKKWFDKWFKQFKESKVPEFISVEEF